MSVIPIVNTDFNREFDDAIELKEKIMTITKERQIIISIDEKGNLHMESGKFSVIEILGILDAIKHRILVDNTTNLKN